MNGSKQLDLFERLLPTAVLLTVLLITFVTVYPFLPAFLWGLMLAVALDPLFERLVRRLGGRRVLAAWISVVLLVLAFVLPAAGLGRALLTYLPDALVWIEDFSVTIPDKPPASLDGIPAIGPPLAEFWHSVSRDASGVASHFGSELKSLLIWTLTEVEVLGVFILEFALGVVLAVVMVYRSKRLTELSSKFFHRLGGEFAQRMAAHSVETTRLAVRGVLGAALAQTLVATFAYIVAGVPGWIIWAGVTFILSLVQAGPVLIWLPMSIWLWASDRFFMAVFMFLWGALVVNLTDNIVRPYLVSKDSNVPASLAFLGAVGGLLQWGVLGVFLGPVVLAVCHELIIKWLEPETLPEEPISDG